MRKRRWRCWSRPLLQASDERLEAPQGVGLDAVADARPVDLAADEAGLLQHFQVLGDGGLGKRQFLADVAADAGLAADEQADDLDARGMAERLGQEREFLVGGLALDGAEVRFLVRLGRGSAGGSQLHVVRHGRILYRTFTIKSPSARNTRLGCG